MSKLVQKIERYFQDRYGRDAIYLPSGRLGLYLAFREWLRPGDRLMMSSVNCDVVLFTALAAGLIPVIGPVNPETGNLDPDAVDQSIWSSVQAILTGNLYGIPERMDRLEEISRKHGVRLIEDACQAFDSRYDHRRIGTFSEVSVFSLSKHVEGIGGVLAFSEEGRRSSLLARADAELRRSSVIGGLVRSLVAQTENLDVIGVIRRLRKRSTLPVKIREGHRMPYIIEEVVRAREDGAGLERFDQWVGTGNKRYKTIPDPVHVSVCLRKLEAFEENRCRRIEGARKLLRLGMTPSGLPVSDECGLYRVPLFVKDREVALRRFADRGLLLDSIYDPPLAYYASDELADKVPSLGAADCWSLNVLPVDPLRADRFLEILEDQPPLVPALAP